MKEGRYTDPKNKVDIRPKIANVIVTYVPENQIEFVPVRSPAEPHEYEHYNENKLETIKFTLACHNHYKAGAEYDIIIVDNDSKDKEALEYINSLPYQVFHRENVGFSFGGYKMAWDMFGDKYDYYVFNEQDGVPAKDGWLLDLVNRFVSEGSIGSVGNNVEAHNLESHYCRDIKTLANVNRDFIYNLDGFMSFTSSKILKQVEVNGGFKIVPVKGDVLAEYNELLSQQPILELGYKLSAFNDGEHMSYHGVSFLKKDPAFKDMSYDKMAPMVLGHTRLYALKDYFSWYGQ